MKNVLEAKSENEPPENLGHTSIEQVNFRIIFVLFQRYISCVFLIQLMLDIVRYVRHLDTTVLALHIKTKLCQLVDAMMKRRDDLSFRQEMKFRNKLVEYLTDWAMGNSHQVKNKEFPKKQFKN